MYKYRVYVLNFFEKYYLILIFKGNTNGNKIYLLFFIALSANQIIENHTKKTSLWDILLYYTLYIPIHIIKTFPISIKIN